MFNSDNIKIFDNSIKYQQCYVQSIMITLCLIDNNTLKYFCAIRYFMNQ